MNLILIKIPDSKQIVSIELYPCILHTFLLDDLFRENSEKLVKESVRWCCIAPVAKCKQETS